MSAELSVPESQVVQDLHNKIQQKMNRPMFSLSQLEDYFDRIKLPTSSRIYNVESLEPSKALDYLALIQHHQLVTIPFENLTLHYSWHRVIHVDPHHLFKKIVQQPGRGGYCMENNTLLHTVLISLGFDAYTAGARIYKGPGYGGFTHCINIVTIADTRYLVDTGFGANGPIQPTKLGTSLAGQINISPAKIRIRQDSIDQGLNRRGLFWICETLIKPDAEWRPLYCFTDMEFIPEDIKVINMAPGLSPTSWFTQKVVCVRYSTDREFPEGQQGVDSKSLVENGICGEFIIDGDGFKWRKNGETLYQKTLENETERIDTLRDVFGIVLDEMDIDAIKGRVSEIKLKMTL